jgi:DNA-binding response OmpR family regulator
MQVNGRGAKIMVAEHDRAILELLQIRLDVAGYHPIGVRDGAAAIELLQNVRPDALVVDMNLPERDGFEVLKALNGHRQRVPTPALIMGRNLSAESVKRAVSLGARDCLAKPFSGADALDRVMRLLQRPAACKPVRYV